MDPGAVRDRHRLAPIHAALVVPDYATGAGKAGVVPRMDPRGRCAEWEYVLGDVDLVAFRTQVQFGPDSGQPKGVEVAGWTAYLVRGAADAVEMIIRSEPRG